MTILLVAALFAGCSTDGKFRKKTFNSTVCGGTVSGYSVTYVAYGDAKLLVIPLTKIRNDTEWRFILKPLKLRKSVSGNDYGGSKVTITGKATPGNNDWINTAGTGPGDEISGTYNGAADHTLRACVKIMPAPALHESFYFAVDVEDVGTLDPRADVY